VDGIDILLVGPYDLGNNIGHPVTGDFSPELKTAIETIKRAAANAGKKSGIYATSGDQARAYADQGFNMVCSLTAIPSLRQPSLMIAFLDLGSRRRGCSPNVHV
jgi:4-hydroxy-2-oxoheptanedioate aldolase